ncbi:MAG: thiamine-phosphate pyrophosphorylase [Alphaproteobacteria bacterium]|nr:thiamine-phosphate pyrophosphorylase [Alphaproteobacteria bacterium]
MAPREQRIEARRVAPRLYLLPPPVADAGGLGEALAAALGAADVAAVLLSLAAAVDRTLINRVMALAPAIQDSGAALLIDSYPDIVARAGADGAHLTGIEAFEGAVGALKPARIAGCGGLVSRHDAMVAAVGGADYVMFGEPDEGQRRPSFDAVIERIEWWAEVFEAPCVGFAGGLDEVAPLATAGADFVAVGEWIFADARGPALAIAEAAGRLADLETAG